MISDELATKLNFSLPGDFIAYRDKGGGDLPPWSFVDDEMALILKQMVNEHYTLHRDCLPFARNTTSDDMVLFTSGGQVRPLHMYASEGWESSSEYGSFREWLPTALDDCLALLERIAARSGSK
jgi:hypothetical protein